MARLYNIHVEVPNPIGHSRFTHFQELAGKNIHNKNILLSGFGDIHPFNKPPKFIGAQRVFLYHNYHYFHQYWINKETFPTKPEIYLFSYYPCYKKVLDEGFVMHLDEWNYNNAIKEAENKTLIKKISEEEFIRLVKECEPEMLVTSYYD